MSIRKMASLERRPVLLVVLCVSNGFALTVERILVSVSMIFCAALLPGAAYAACSQGSGGVYAIQVALPASVSIPRDAGIGATIAEGTVTVPFNASSPTGVYCDAATTAVYSNLVGDAVTGTVMPTRVPGVGYQILVGGNYYAAGTVSLPASTFYGSSCGQSAVGSKCYGYIGSPLTVRLVKTAMIVNSATVPGGADIFAGDRWNHVIYCVACEQYPGGRADLHCHDAFGRGFVGYCEGERVHGCRLDIQFHAVSDWAQLQWCGVERGYHLHGRQ